MPYSIRPTEQISAAVQRIALEQIDRAIAAIDDDALPRTEAVYAVRKRCKKLRAVLRLTRGPLEERKVYKKANAALRDIAAGFALLRDADVMLASYDRLMAMTARGSSRPLDRRAFGPIRAQLTRRRVGLLESFDPDLETHLEEARWLLLKVRLGMADWRFEEEGFAAIEPGLRKIYRQALSAGEVACDTGRTEELHEWRKSVKYHRNHLRLLKKMAPDTLAPRILKLWRLGDLLGLDHDLAVLQEAVRSDPAFANIAARRRFLIPESRQRKIVQSEIWRAADAMDFPNEDTMISQLAGLWNIGMNRPVATRIAIR